MKKYFFKKYIIVLFLSFLVIVLGAVKFVNKDRQWEIPIIPTPTITPKPTEIKKSFSEEYPLWDKLPYSGNGYRIEEYSQPLTLKIINKNADIEEMLSEIATWMRKEGVDPETHQIEVEEE